MDKNNKQIKQFDSISSISICDKLFPSKDFPFANLAFVKMIGDFSFIWKVEWKEKKKRRKSFEKQTSKSASINRKKSACKAKKGSLLKVSMSKKKKKNSRKKAIGC